MISRGYDHIRMFWNDESENVTVFLSLQECLNPGCKRTSELQLQ